VLRLLILIFFKMSTFQTISPIDNSVYIEREIANTKAIENALVAAKSAQKTWRQTTIAERAT